jgi:hypothetical protein
LLILVSIVISPPVCCSLSVIFFSIALLMNQLMMDIRG